MVSLEGRCVVTCVCVYHAGCHQNDYIVAVLWEPDKATHTLLRSCKISPIESSGNLTRSWPTQDGGTQENPEMEAAPHWVTPTVQ